MCESERTTLEWLFLLAFAMVLVTPLVVMLKHAKQSSSIDELGGVELAAALPTLTTQGALDGTFQSAFDRWFAKHLGIRKALIRADNQLNYSLFSLTATGTVLGKDNFLFEPNYIEEFNNMRPMSDLQLQTFVEKLSRLRSLLRARSVHFLVMLTPSKAAMYSEHIPERLLVSPTRADTYDRFTKLVRAQSLPLFDTVPLVRRLKAESPYPVFPPGGAHWSKYVSCKAGEAFTDQLQALLGREVPKLRCDPPLIKTKASGVDRDLAQLANLWRRNSFDVPLPSPRVRVESAKDAYRAKLLFIGDSFLWSFFEALERKLAYASRDFFYYYKSHDRFRARRRALPKVPIDRAAIDWSHILSRDAIVLEMNEFNIRDVGYGFVDDALQHLESGTVHSGAR